MDYLDYREQLGIGFNDDAKVTYFITSMCNCLNLLCAGIQTYRLSQIEYLNYCNRAGIRADYFDTNGGMRFGDVVQSLVGCNKSLNEFVFRYVSFVNSIDENNNCLGKKVFIDCILKCFDQAHISMEVIQDKDGYFILPAGAKELDQNLVNQQLIWIKDYPNTRERYASALRKYAEKSDFPSNIAEEFRKTLETFLQEFFGGTKSLENYKSEYGKYLKGKGIPTEISNNLESLFTLYYNYMNNYAKHQNKTEENVLEYLMYQTGIIIRLMITLRNN